MTVFVLQHVHDLGDNLEDTKLIGVYSTLEQANAAVTRFRKAPGFSSFPDGFSVDEYELDVDHWQEGFVNVSGENC